MHKSRNVGPRYTALASRKVCLTKVSQVRVTLIDWLEEGDDPLLFHSESPQEPQVRRLMLVDV